MSKFVKNFITVLKEQDQDSDLEREAMESSLDDGVDPTEFDTNLEANPEKTNTDNMDAAAEAFAANNQKIVSELQGWIDEIKNFLSFLNDSKNPNSIQSRLSKAEDATIMGKMRQAQQTKIARVAADLASLEQNLEGYMSQSSNAKYKYV